MAEPFDREQLLDEIEDDLEFFEEAVGILGQDSGELLSRLAEAIDGSDAAEVASAAHTIKSMVGNFAAAPAQQAAFELELLGKSGDLAGAPAGLETLREEIRRLERALVSLLEESR